MNEWFSISLYSLSAMVAALAQLILKKAALMPNGRDGIMKYMDIRIIGAYIIMMATMFVNMIAMRYMPYKFVPVLSSLSYVFVLILGKFILHERISRKKAIGMFVIFLGMIIFYMG